MATINLLLCCLFLAATASAQLRITTTTVPNATQYQPYATTLIATGGTLPYHWSVDRSSGVSLPEGMSLNAATGIVSATQVNGQGGYAVTVQVTDSASPTPVLASTTLNFGVLSDSTMGGCQMFPPDSIYNQRIDQLPVDTTPSHQIPTASLGRPIHPDFGHGFYPSPGGIPFMRVPANQPLLNVNLASGGQIDSDGTYSWPFPAWPNSVIEGTSYGNDGDDHHILILQSSVNNISGPQAGPCVLYETYHYIAVPDMFDANTKTWNMSAGLHYVLDSNRIAASEATLDNGAQDSAGIPMMPLLIRYSEVPLGVKHPLRITFPSPTNKWVWPGTGCCGGSGPPQGLLYRLKSSVNWQAICPVAAYPQAATVLQALQQYGAYMSDHGSAAFVQGVPDVRWDDDDLACMKQLHASDLEVVDNSMLEVSDLSGQTKPYVVPATLPSAASGASYAVTLSAVGGNPATRRWTVSSGSLPSGLLLDASAGVIAGSPGSSSGPFAITVTDTTSGLASQPQDFSITVTGGLLTVPVTVTSNPSGRSIMVDGNVFTSSTTFNWVPGSTHSLNAASPQGTVTRYLFSSWSDSGAQSHSIVVPATAATYTASFAAQYLLTTNVSPVSSGSIAASPRSDDGYYNAGASVQLTAIVVGGSNFLNFSGDLTGSANPQTILMSAPRNVTANFTGGSAPPSLRITSTHIGSFVQGQSNAAYTLIVSNPAPSPAQGTVTVTETIPAGLTLVSMAGNGWTCSANTCTRADGLDSGVSYPPIGLTVTVNSNAPSQVINQVTVSVGAAVSAPVTDPTTVVPAFTDVLPADLFLPAINLLQEYAITRACQDLPFQYCPTDTITEAQMAVFIVRSVMGSDNFTYTQTPYFADVPATNLYFPWIQKMQDLGIALPCLTNQFCPDASVTRGIMSVLIVRARFGIATPTAYPTAPSFTDVAATHPYFPWIQKMKQIGITAGCSPTTYCPDDPVTRGQMAVFIMRGAFNLLLPANLPIVTWASPATASPGQNVLVTLIGQNTNFSNGVTQVNAGTGITVSNITVSSATSLTAQFTVSLGAGLGPRSITVTTGSEEATLPNSFQVR